MYESNYDKLQSYLRLENVQCQYIDTNAFVLSIISEDIIKDLENFEDLFDFSNLNDNHEILGNIKKKVFEKFKIETSKKITTDEFLALGRKMYAYICGDESKNKIKRISKSYGKNIKFDENRTCLDGENLVEESNNYDLKSKNQEMYVRKTKKSTLSQFDDKHWYINNFESWFLK